MGKPVYDEARIGPAAEVMRGEINALLNVGWDSTLDRAMREKQPAVYN